LDIKLEKVIVGLNDIKNTMILQAFLKPSKFFTQFIKELKIHLKI